MRWRFQFPETEIEVSAAVSCPASVESGGGGEAGFEVEDNTAAAVLPGICSGTGARVKTTPSLSRRCSGALPVGSEIGIDGGVEGAGPGGDLLKRDSGGGGSTALFILLSSKCGTSSFSPTSA